MIKFYTLFTGDSKVHFGLVVDRMSLLGVGPAGVRRKPFATAVSRVITDTIDILRRF